MFHEDLPNDRDQKWREQEEEDEREEAEQMKKEQEFSRAVHDGDVYTVQSLLSTGMDPYTFDTHSSFLATSFESGNEEMVNLLCDYYGGEADDYAFKEVDEDPDKEWWQDPDNGRWEKTGRLRLHKAIEKNKDIKEVLDGDFTLIEQKDEDWRTPLSVAIQMGNREAVKILLLHGADLNADGNKLCCCSLHLPFFISYHLLLPNNRWDANDTVA